MGGLCAATRIAPLGLLVARLTLGLQSENSLHCGNTRTSRQSWCDGYDINTNWYSDWPDTGIVREYWLSVENMTIAPDGVEVQALTFNGSLPGPTLVADWGDWFLIHVTNNLEVNGTSIHWHGIRQLNTNAMDGVPGLTQCPQAPGTTLTYKFQATQYGTTWYHSHFTVQFGAGLNGAIVINGPATINYDVDIGAITLQDWFHWSLTPFGALEWDDNTQSNPTADGALINGTNIYPCDQKTPKCTGTGKRWETTVQKGRKYRLRLINSSVQNYYRFTIDNHRFWIIANDLVPVHPYDTDSLVIAEGQRFDIVFEAEQEIGNYWVRAMYQISTWPMAHPNNTLGILRYEGADQNADPVSENYLMDSIYASHANGPGYADILEPWLSTEVGNVGGRSALFLERNADEDKASYLIDWESPTIQELAEGQNLKYDASLNKTDYRHQNKLPGWNLPNLYNGSTRTAEDVIRIPQKNQWIYFYINNYVDSPENHPMHLHGHDFFILSQGTRLWYPNNGTIATKNPPRRDTATLFNHGHLVMAIETKNPGIWLVHCHIAWHVSQGLAWQFIEREDEILDLYDMEQVNNTCKSWKYWVRTTDGSVWGQDDSGD